MVVVGSARLALQSRFAAQRAFAANQRPEFPFACGSTPRRRGRILASDDFFGTRWIMARESIEGAKAGEILGFVFRM